MIYTFFMGSYTEYLLPDFGGIGHGIYTVQLNSETGGLTILHIEKTRNPSYLAISDYNQFLYCNTEIDQNETPMVRAYRIKNDWSLHFLNEQPIPGGYPCHITVHENNALVACYASGNVIQFPIKANGELLKAKKDFRHKGSSINKARQEAPHAHQVSVHPNKKDIYVCDLGIDSLKAYHLVDNELMADEEKDCLVSGGGGPRHLVFSIDGSLAYVINELTGNISILKHKDGSFEEVGLYPSLPEEYVGLPSASAIRLHPNGRFLYVANRGFEAITVFKIADGELELLGYQHTQGKELREFNITPDGNWLIACHQNSHDTIVYNIKKNGTLSEKYRTQEILSPVCVAFQH